MKPNSREAKRIVPLFPKSGNSKSPKKRAQHGIPQNLPFGSLPGNSNQNRSSSVIPSGPPQKKRKTSLAYQEEKKPSRFEYPKFTQNQFENSDFILEEEETEEKNMMNYFNISSNIPQTNNFRFNPVNPQYSSSLISSRIETSQLQSEIAKVRVKITEPDSKVVSEFCFNQSSLATLSVTQIVKDVSWVDGNPILRFRPSFPLFFIEVLGQVKQILKSPTEESSNYHLYLTDRNSDISMYVVLWGPTTFPISEGGVYHLIGYLKYTTTGNTEFHCFWVQSTTDNVNLINEYQARRFK